MRQRKLLKKSEILAMAQIFPKTLSGIYFLISGEEIVYVGKSKNILARITAHRRKNKNQFEKFAFVECPTEELNDLEGFYINTFMPKQNESFPILRATDRIKVDEVLYNYNLTRKKFNHLTKKYDIKIENGYVDRRWFDLSYKRETGAMRDVFRINYWFPTE